MNEVIKKWWFWVIAGFVVLIFISTCSDNKKETVMVEKSLETHSDLFAIQVGSKNIMVNDMELTLEAPVREIDWHSYMPLRFFLDWFGAEDVTYDRTTEVITFKLNRHTEIDPAVLKKYATKSKVVKAEEPAKQDMQGNQTQTSKEPEPEPDPEPEPIPESFVYTGNGDSVIKIQQPEEGPLFLYITGNEANRHFAVTGFDSNDNRTNLFVNKTSFYKGITLDPSGTTVTLEIKAQGPWSVETRSSRSLRVVKSPGSITGSGDEVVMVQGSPRMANIKGNPNKRHFAIIGYNPSNNLLVNTTEVYSGTVRMQRNIFLLEIKAEGQWEISLE